MCLLMLFGVLPVGIGRFLVILFVHEILLCLNAKRDAAKRPKAHETTEDLMNRVISGPVESRSLAYFSKHNQSYHLRDYET